MALILRLEESPGHAKTILEGTPFHFRMAIPRVTPIASSDDAMASAKAAIDGDMGRV
jgi:hypothetical protein